MYIYFQYKRKIKIRIYIPFYIFQIIKFYKYKCILAKLISTTSK